MQLVTPRVVAMAVRMLIANWTMNLIVCLVMVQGVLAVVLGVDIVLGSLLGAHAAEHHDG